MLSSPTPNLDVTRIVPATLPKEKRRFYQYSNSGNDTDIGQHELHSEKKPPDNLKRFDSEISLLSCTTENDLDDMEGLEFVTIGATYGRGIFPTNLDIVTIFSFT